MKKLISVLMLSLLFLSFSIGCTKQKFDNDDEEETPIEEVEVKEGTEKITLPELIETIGETKTIIVNEHNKNIAVKVFNDEVQVIEIIGNLTNVVEHDKNTQLKADYDMMLLNIDDEIIDTIHISEDKNIIKFVDNDFLGELDINYIMNLIQAPDEVIEQ